MSGSVRPHRRQPTRFPRPWDSPGKNTGVGCHFLLQCMKVKSEKWKWNLSVYPTLSDPMDCSPPGSSVHGVFQARVLEWGAITFSYARKPKLEADEVLWGSNWKCAVKVAKFVLTLVIKSKVKVLFQIKFIMNLWKWTCHTQPLLCGFGKLSSYQRTFWLPQRKGLSAWPYWR